MSHTLNIENSSKILGYFFMAQATDLTSQLEAGSRYIELHFYEDAGSTFYVSVGQFLLGAGSNDNFATISGITKAFTDTSTEEIIVINISQFYWNPASVA